MRRRLTCKLAKLAPEPALLELPLVPVLVHPAPQRDDEESDHDGERSATATPATRRPTGS
jgi:hypothetical protein